MNYYSPHWSLWWLLDDTIVLIHFQTSIGFPTCNWNAANLTFWDWTSVAHWMQNKLMSVIYFKLKCFTFTAFTITVKFETKVIIIDTSDFCSFQFSMVHYIKPDLANSCFKSCSTVEPAGKKAEAAGGEIGGESSRGKRKWMEAITDYT